MIKVIYFKFNRQIFKYQPMEILNKYIETKATAEISLDAFFSYQFYL